MDVDVTSANISGPSSFLFSSSSAPSSTIPQSHDQSMITDSLRHLNASSSSAATEVPPPRIFALVVAIDRYKSPIHGNLTGCENDGRRFIHFLTEDLGVPSSHIRFLPNEDATEEAILTTFHTFLVQNKDIQRDDAIVFFFAGHGSQLIAPPGWVTDNDKIETLCPHDVNTEDADGKSLWGISDRAINALMNHLASEKGDNIVAVFDCCHSGGLSRALDADDRTLLVRSIPPPPRPPPADLNQDIFSSIPELCARGAKTACQKGCRYKAMTSHVLLAACRPDEFAMEDPALDAPGGLFTNALIDCLRHNDPHDTSYTRLFERLDVKYKRQHPVCEGLNKDRLLFSINTLRSGETTFKVFMNGQKLRVSAGSIHGVVVGTEFAVKTPTQTLVLKAEKVGDFESVLGGSHLSITEAKAKVSNWCHPTLEAHAPFHYSSTHVTIVPADKPADIALRQGESGQWELERRDPLIPAYSDRFITFEADTERAKGILDSIANFNSYLYRPDRAVATFAGKVKMRMRRLGTDQGEINPVGDDLLRDTRASYRGVGVKEAIITDLDAQYSFTLENTSKVDLFPYFFYFDPSDYSVQLWYKPQSSATPAPLKRIKADGTPSVFAFGYGGFGTDPVEFYLPEGSKSDSGFLKVFLTTTYVDMSTVAQPPIDEVLGSRWGRLVRKGKWASETVVLTCRKP